MVVWGGVVVWWWWGPCLPFLLLGGQLSGERSQSVSGRICREGMLEILLTFSVLECSLPPKHSLTAHPETLEENTRP